MASRKVDYLLIGGGLASANCARWLREEGADGTVLVVGREPDPPYNRPNCSKGYLRGKEERSEAFFRPQDWWGEQRIELLTRTSVTAFDPQTRTAKLSNREDLEFGQALLATGANVRRLNVPGCELEQIHYLRTLGNSDAIRAGAAEAEHVVLIGGSYIGCEVAASLTMLGKRCTIVMQENVTLERGFGAQAGRFFQELLEEHGVTVHGNDELERFEGAGRAASEGESRAASEGEGRAPKGEGRAPKGEGRAPSEGESRIASEGEGRVAKVITKGGLELPADLVVIGAGVTPDVQLARGAGLQIGESGGVRCSSRLATSAPGVFAAGDICEYDSPVHGAPLRIEHWDVAFNHGKTAALNMLGRDIPHETVPYFFSVLGDWGELEYVGPARDWDEEIVRGSLADGSFTTWYVRDGRLAAALTFGRSDDLDHARRLLAARTELDAVARRALADVDSELGDLA